jgi:hypothetical protein
LDRSLFQEKNLDVYEGLTLNPEQAESGIELKLVEGRKNKETALTIWFEAFPELLFRGTVPGKDGEFQLQSVRFLGGNLWGWNEFTLDIAGAGTFTLTGPVGELRIEPALEQVQISSGKIRHKENRLIGDQALGSLRNRYDRIIALTDWMHSLPEVPRFEGQRDFEAYWKPLLLPELVSAKKRPPDFVKAQAVWVWAEDIRWNTTYTESLFPEALWNFRNSGALIRDWEEAAAWIYIQYQWDYIVELISNVYTVIEIK